VTAIKDLNLIKVNQFMGYLTPVFRRQLSLQQCPASFRYADNNLKMSHLHRALPGNLERRAACNLALDGENVFLSPKSSELTAKPGTFQGHSVPFSRPCLKKRLMPLWFPTRTATSCF
jgi:hypothetical protein